MSRRIEHERRCLSLVRQRRAREGKPPAQWVMDAWRQKMRLLRCTKEKAK